MNKEINKVSSVIGPPVNPLSLTSSGLDQRGFFFFHSFLQDTIFYFYYYILLFILLFFYYIHFI